MVCLVFVWFSMHSKVQIDFIKTNYPLSFAEEEGEVPRKSMETESVIIEPKEVKYRFTTI